MRRYDAQLGRWISADTIVPEPANPQSLNRYSYVYNNPLKYVDPSGHRPCWFYCDPAEILYDEKEEEETPEETLADVTSISETTSEFPLPPRTSVEVITIPPFVLDSRNLWSGGFLPVIHLRYAIKGSVRIQPEGTDSFVLKPLKPDIEIKGVNWKFELGKFGAYVENPSREQSLGCGPEGCAYSSAMVDEFGFSFWPTIKEYHGSKQVTTFRIGNGQEIVFRSTCIYEKGINLPEAALMVIVYGARYFTGRAPDPTHQQTVPVTR